LPGDRLKVSETEVVAFQINEQNDTIYLSDFRAVFGV